MTSFGNIAKGVIDTLTPEPETERLIFRRFKGSGLAEAAETGSSENVKVETVALKINPQQISYAERKVIQKVPTASPGRFIVFDWGSELTILTIQGCTGLLLPASITSGFDPGLQIAEGVVNKMNQFGAGLNNPFGGGLTGIGGGSIAAALQNIMIGTMSYYDLLNMSPKYKMFEKLRNMYHNMDADIDVLTLEMGDIVYRGFFEDFSFEIIANEPWNWKYSITFVIMEDLSKSVRRGDDSYNKDNISNE